MSGPYFFPSYPIPISHPTSQRKAAEHFPRGSTEHSSQHPSLLTELSEFAFTAQEGKQRGRIPPPCSQALLGWSDPDLLSTPQPVAISLRYLSVKPHGFISAVMAFVIWLFVLQHISEV